MNPIDKRILDFIREHHILTLAVTRDRQPWCATCFYAFDEVRNIFIFTSEDDTRHIRDAAETGNYRVAGAIALETKMIGKIRGVQFTGEMFKLEGEELKAAKKHYLKQFPVARLSELYLWGLCPGHIKMTDNRLGFGKKLMWYA
ncbi:MAG: pyridoxamine 5'-phosphate oxidase family protein [Bacteroidetes bacterium]|nr:pyridoxamine 5'-phosphate oxidase family protein [Bacteroidota bacterium]